MMDRTTAKLTAIFCIAMFVAAGAGPSAFAAVVVIANRTPETVQLNTVVDDGPVTPLVLPPGDSRPLFANNSARVRVPQADGSSQDISLEPDSAYYVGLRLNDGSPALRKLGLGENGRRPWKPAANPPFQTADSGVITVKVLVDDDEMRQRRVWEPLIRQRIDKASAVLDAHCGIRLRVVAIDTWDSDDRETDFERSLAEFESEVLPSPAVVAIGFSSQYVIAQGRVHLGGTRGPLHSHILIKERSNNVLEPERLELLVHELGHFLGATHSPEQTSVMRPVVGQGLQRAAGAHNQFDPPNTLLMSLLAQEIRQRHVRELSSVSEETRRRMQQIYTAINPTLPDDPAAQHYVQLVSSAGVGPLIEDTRRILAEIARVAQVRKKVGQRENQTGKDAAPPQLNGDELLEFYVRQAALAAKNVRRDNAPRAFLLALGVALDDAGLLRTLPSSSEALPHFEGEAERTQRVAAVGRPTMRGQAYIARHFFAAAHLVALTGSQNARSPKLVKEIADSQRDSHFNAAELAANRAGIVFAFAVLSGRLTLEDIAQRFTIDAVLLPEEKSDPPVDGKKPEEDFRTMEDAVLQGRLEQFEASVVALPFYQTLPAPAPAGSIVKPSPRR